MSAQTAFGLFEHDALREIEDKSYWFQHRNRVIAALLRRYPMIGLFADVGGGNGCVAAHLAQLGYDVAVIEPGTGGCHNARARGLRAHATTLTESPFGTGSLGAIGLFDVIEHIADASEFLTTCRERLATGGRLYVTVPAYSWLWSTADIEAGHVRRYTRQSLRALVAGSGYKIEFSSYIFFAFVPALALVRALPYRFGARPSTVEHFKRDHTPGGTIQRLAEKTLFWEVARIENSHAIAFGTSVVMVAKPHD